MARKRQYRPGYDRQALRKHAIELSKGPNRGNIIIGRPYECDDNSVWVVFKPDVIQAVDRHDPEVVTTAPLRTFPMKVQAAVEAAVIRQEQDSTASRRYA